MAVLQRAGRIVLRVLAVAGALALGLCVSPINLLRWGLEGNLKAVHELVAMGRLPLERADLTGSRPCLVPSPESLPCAPALVPGPFSRHMTDDAGVPSE